MRRLLLVAALLVAACSPGQQDGDPPDTERPPDPRTDPGRFAMRRLTRAEYDRTVRDLLATPRRPGRDFPADPASDGFDTVAEAASTSPLLVQLYDQAAATLAADVVRDAWTPDPRPVGEEDMALTTSTPDRTADVDGQMALLGGFRGSVPLSVATPGAYVLAVSVSVLDAGMRVRVLVDGAPIASAQVAQGRSKVLTGRFTSDDTLATVAVEVDRVGTAEGKVLVAGLTLQGPIFDAEVLAATRARVLPCDLDGDDPRACAREALATLGRRALRRTVDPAELDAWLATYDAVVAAGDTPAWGFEFALRRVLLDPWFLFLVEERAPAGSEPVPVDGFTLAARLSFLLWGSTPDDALLDRAERGELADPDVLADEAARLLHDPRAAGFVEDFAGQWLGVRLLDGAQPDAATFPGWSEALRASMRGELTAFLGSFVGSGRDLRELLTGTDAWVDPRLAAFYGLEPPADGFEARDGTPVGRGGLLGMAGLLTGLSHPTRTSPVKRGAWVLGQLLCDPPDPPPPGVPLLPTPSEEAMTVRERLAAHRTNPVCASCHAVMDPVGLAFEHFDAVGAWRDTEAGEPVDASGAAPDGTVVDGVPALAAHVAADPRFEACVVDRLFTHAMRRSPDEGDAATLEVLRGAFVDGGHALDALVDALVRSDAFRTRRPEDP
jgi:hypothetical protein